MWGNGKKVVYIESNYIIIMTRTQRTHTQNLTGTDRKERHERSHADVYDVVTTTFPITTNHSDTQWFTKSPQTTDAETSSFEFFRDELWTRHVVHGKVLVRT